MVELQPDQLLTALFLGAHPIRPASQQPLANLRDDGIRISGRAGSASVAAVNSGRPR